MVDYIVGSNDLKSLTNNWSGINVFNRITYIIMKLGVLIMQLYSAYIIGTKFIYFINYVGQYRCSNPPSYEGVIIFI